MLALKATILIVCSLVGVQALITGYEEADSESSCYQTYLNRTSVTGPTCLEQTNCAKCYAWANGYLSKNITSVDLGAFNDFIQRLLNYGLNLLTGCDVSFFQILIQVKIDLLGSLRDIFGTLSTIPPYGPSTTAPSARDSDSQEQCFELIRSDGYAPISCSVAREFLQCIILAEGYHLKQISAWDLAQIQYKLSSLLLRLKIYCFLDVGEIIEEIRRRTTATSTYRPPTSPTRPSTTSYARTSTTTQPPRTYPSRRTTTAEPITYPPRSTTTAEPITYPPRSTTTAEPITYPPRSTTTAEPITYPPRSTTTAEPITYPPRSTTTAEPITYPPRSTTTQEPITYPPRSTTTAEPITYPPRSTTSRATTSLSTTAQPGYSGCIRNGCAGRIDGNYPKCYPECQDGRYYSCVAGTQLYERDCPIAYYRSQSGGYRLERLVYNPITDSCEYSTSSCPRDLDNFLLSKRK